MPRAKKTSAPVHIVREFRSSPVIYGPLRSKSNDDVHPNPDYHPTVLLSSTGRFYDESYRELDPADVPQSVRDKAKKTVSMGTEFKKRSRKLGMADAMLAAGVTDTEPDPQVRATRRGAAAKRAIA